MGTLIAKHGLRGPTLALTRKGFSQATCLKPSRKSGTEPFLDPAKGCFQLTANESQLAEACPHLPGYDGLQLQTWQSALQPQPWPFPTSSTHDCGSHLRSLIMGNNVRKARLLQWEGCFGELPHKAAPAKVPEKASSRDLLCSVRGLRPGPDMFKIREADLANNTQNTEHQEQTGLSLAVGQT